MTAAAATPRLRKWRARRRDEQISVQVVDMQGRLIYSKIEGLKAGKENVISLDNVERGVYLISVSSDKGRYTQSIVIQ